MAKTQRDLIKKQVFIYQYCYEHVKPHREFPVDENLRNERTTFCRFEVALFSSALNRGSSEQPTPSRVGEDQGEPYVTRNIFKEKNSHTYLLI